MFRNNQVNNLDAKKRVYMFVYFKEKCRSPMVYTYVVLESHLSDNVHWHLNSEHDIKFLGCSALLGISIGMNPLCRSRETLFQPTI